MQCIVSGDRSPLQENAGTIAYTTAWVRYFTIPSPPLHFNEQLRFQTEWIIRFGQFTRANRPTPPHPSAERIAARSLADRIAARSLADRIADRQYHLHSTVNGPVSHRSAAWMTRRTIPPQQNSTDPPHAIEYRS